MIAAQAVGLVLILAYVGVIIIVMVNSSKSGPVEKLSHQSKGERTPESMPAEALPPRFLSPPQQSEPDGTRVQIRPTAGQRSNKL
ncbi:MAG: hypothetical protein ABSE51_19975 [Terracidiphilus sp.]